MSNVVATLRRFNRTHTQRIGALDDSFLGSGRPLGPARLLFEIGPDGAPVSQLRTRLGLDSGYASRLLRGLEDDGLVEVVPDPADGRRRDVRLTTGGQRAWTALDARSDRLARHLVAPLPSRQRERLAAALTTADLLLRAATVTFEPVPPDGDAARFAMRRYFDELDRRFPAGFDPGDALDDGATAFAPPGGRFVVAFGDGEPIACGGIQEIETSTGEIKRMWVHPDWRGAGLGRRMLDRLEHEAASLGLGRIILDTNETLVEAIAMYEGAGYQAIGRYNDNPYAGRWFAKTLSP